MRLLFILTELPFPASRNGVALINHELLANAPEGLQIDLLITNVDESDNVAQFRRQAPCVGEVTFTNEPLSRKYRVGNLLSGILTGRNRFTQRAASAFLEARQGRYAAIYVAPLMTAFDLNLAQPLFLNAVDSFAKLNENAYMRSGRTRDRLKMWMYRMYERRCLGSAQLINFVSSADLKSVQHRQPSLPLVSISNGVDSDVFRPEPSRTVPGRLLFTGNFDYMPNAQAAVHLVQNIFPRVRSSHPHATLQIVGRNPPREVMGVPGVEATGFADDIVACYQAAELFVCPLLSGAGVKNKVLEALSSGLPIVTSALGVDGMAHLVEGQHYVLADDPETFADAVNKLLANEPHRASLKRLAREVAVQNFSWAPVVDSYFQCMATVSNTRKALA